MKKYNIAIVGATGAVGMQVMSILAERDFPYGNVYALASANSVGKKVSFGEDKVISTEDLRSFDFGKVDIVFSCAGSDVSRQFVENATAKGAVVIDKTSLFRLDEDVPLIVPEVNPHQIKNFSKRKIISNPNCCTIPIVVALAPLHNAAKIKRIVASTYQSVSGAGKDGMDELYNQTKAKYMQGETAPNVFEKQIAFNIIPKIGDLDEDGNSDEEQKIVSEIQKILGNEIKISVTSVRVPVFIGHSIALNVEFHDKIDAKEAYELLEESDGLVVLDKNSTNTPIDVAGDDFVYVSRIRNDNSAANTINLWVATDNLRKGAALNSVQIAEELVQLT